ncbi:MAG: hypothetical protein IJL81_00685 [Clostridia bacterium]|nr:hypothetical protein [Clostridia bacterium]
MKLNLDFALYKGKTRLREWWKVVKAHFTAVQDAVNELDTDITTEATERARVDGVLFDNITDTAAAIAAETSAREEADRQLNESLTRHYQYIENERNARRWADDAIRKSKLSFFDFGAYNVTTKTVENSNANEHYDETLEAIGSFENGSIIRFSVSADCSEVNIPVVLYDGYLNEHTAHINISHSFTAGHTYTARVSAAPALGSQPGPHTVYYTIDGTADVITDNDVSIGASSAIIAETTERARVDGVLFDNITDAAAAIAAETSARTAAENEIKSDITALQGASHTHGNKDVLDGITAADIEHLRELKVQVTEEQLNSVYDFFAEVAYAHDREMQNIYAAMGCTVYDGGLFGAPVDGAELDGGEFGDEESGTVDGGDFEPFRCSCGGGGTQTIDGGGYDNVSGSVIDGGSLDETGGTVYDGGVYP